MIMHTPDGARFQEKALALLDYKGSQAHKMIGALVTAINNGTTSYTDALIQYLSALVKR